jgi:hypothetical protein
MLHRGLFIAFATLAVGACATGPHPALKLASRDLGCEQSQLKLEQIYPKKVRIEGCGKTAIYVDACNDGYGTDATCGWGRQYANAFERDVAEHEKAEREHAEAEQAAAERESSEQAKAEREAKNREKAEQAKAAKEKAEQEKADKEKAAQAKADNDKAEQAKGDKEKAERAKADEAEDKSGQQPKAARNASDDDLGL